MKAEVRLVDVSHVPRSSLKGILPAEDGLRLVFLVIPRSPEPAKPLFRELRDFTVNDSSYRLMSLKKLGREIEPITDVVDPAVVRQLSSAAGKKIDGALPPSAIGMFVDISGCKLPSNGKVWLQLQVGWNESLESFDFEFELGKVPQETVFSRYGAEK